MSMAGGRVYTGREGFAATGNEGGSGAWDTCASGPRVETHGYRCAVAPRLSRATVRAPVPHRSSVRFCQLSMVAEKMFDRGQERDAGVSACESVGRAAARGLDMIAYVS